MGKYLYQAIITPDEDGGFDVSVPALPGCFTFGDTLEEAAEMAADAMRTYVAAMLAHGEEPPKRTIEKPEGGSESMLVWFETDEDYIIEGEVVSAAEAARRLNVSAGRVTHMLASGVLRGYRRGRRTYVTVSSIDNRLKSKPAGGRPRKKTA